MIPYNIALFLAATLLSIHCIAAQGDFGLQTNPGVVISNAAEGRPAERHVEATGLLRSKRFVWGYPYGWTRPWGFYPWSPWWRSYGWPHGWVYYPWLKA
ncbi:unnamed protein product [Cylicocyclus nassatus]|uniref:Uncharacterized protein n=1 Tax=Cylicocyclus nassatus TaxID=53992 RepID=A0AA36H674_CYLNA|nr:unnamed protein product [Cylicocyclus nassatus]